MTFADLKPGDVFSFKIWGYSGIAVKTAEDHKILNLVNYCVGSVRHDLPVVFEGRLEIVEGSPELKGGA